MGAPLDESKLTNANNRPDYNFDEIYGLAYDIDVSQPVGSRISNVTYKGAALDDNQQFVLAVNNYRANGGGNFPHVAAAQVVWSSSAEIRNTMISWVQSKGEINPKDFFLNGWKLVRAGVPLYA
ncbi:5'-nucleotidase C-terminal domain-containing protein [Streptacidiphilus monticola]